MNSIPPALDDSHGRSALKSYFDQPPPQYAEATSPRSSKISDHSQRSSKATTEIINFSNGPWLLRRTSIVVETEPSDVFSNDGKLSRLPSTAARLKDAKGDPRKPEVRQNGHKLGQERLSHGRTPWHTSQPFDTGFGVKVFIEAGKPKQGKSQRQHDMKGLEQAASMKRWPGGGRSGEAWGKLAKVRNASSRREGLLLTRD